LFTTKFQSNRHENNIHNMFFQLYDTDAGKKEIQLQLEKMKKSALPLVQINDVQKHRPWQGRRPGHQRRTLRAHQRLCRALLGRPSP
jgi:hypothetical protein